MAADPDKPLMRCLGEFVGHIFKAVRTDPSKETQVVRHDVEETTRQTTQGRITLRRTVVEEVRIDRKEAPE